MIPAVILAGGQASRMGGGDKCLREVGGRTLLDLVLERLRPQAAPLVLNANGDPARFDRFSLPVIADSLPDFAGPLAGVLAGMDWAEQHGFSQIISVAADTPFFPCDLAERLRAQGPLALAATQHADRIRRQPTFGLWPVALRDDLRSALASGLRKVALYADQHGAAEAVWPAEDTDPFFNINTPEDIAAAEARLRAMTAS